LFLVVFIFCQIFAIFIPRYGQIKEEKADILSNKLFWSEASAVYGIMALGTILSFFCQFNDITISMALITVFTMVFVTILALITTINNPDLRW